MKEKQCPKKAIHSVAASYFALYPPVRLKVVLSGRSVNYEVLNGRSVNHIG